MSTFRQHVTKQINVRFAGSITVESQRTHIFEDKVDEYSLATIGQYTTDWHTLFAVVLGQEVLNLVGRDVLHVHDRDRSRTAEPQNRV